MLSAMLLALTACAGSTPSIKVQPVAPIHLVAPDSELTKDCTGPVRHSGAVTQEGVENLWSVDRQSLVICRRAKAELQKFYHDRDAALAAKP